MKHWKFKTNRIAGVATAQPQIQKPIFDFDLTWCPDLWWPGAQIFTQGVLFNCYQVLRKWWRCAPSFFRDPRKTGGEDISPHPPVRVLNNLHGDLLESGIRACPESVGVDKFCRLRLRLRAKQPTPTDSECGSDSDCSALIVTSNTKTRFMWALFDLFEN